jgi:alkylated DNA repair dioxygenase AlkB
MRGDFHQQSLFEPSALPYGLIYRPEFLGRDEETALLAAFAPLPFREARFQEYLAKRRVVHFHGPERVAISSPPEDDTVVSLALPPLLHALRQRIGAWLELPPASFVHALVSEYRPGTPIGWHRDKPAYGIVVGVSLQASAIMRFRPMPGRRSDGIRPAVVLELEPRSAYIMRGPIRWDWQHSMPPVKALRYSVTFRTRATEHPRA